MPRPHVPGAALALALLIGPAAPTGEAKDGAERPGEEPALYELRAEYKAQPGDTVRVVHSHKTDVLVTIRRRGAPIGVENHRLGFELKYTDTLRIADDARAEVERSYDWVKDLATGQVDRATRRVVLRWGPDGFTREPLDGPLHPIVAAQLDREEHRPRGLMDAMIPARPLAVGARWAIPTKAAVALFGFDPEHVLSAGARCTGTFRQVQRRGSLEMLRVVLQFRFDLTRVGDLEFLGEPARFESEADTWFPAHGATPWAVVRVRGSAAGETRVRGAPANVTATYEITSEGDLAAQLVPRPPPRARTPSPPR